MGQEQNKNPFHVNEYGIVLVSVMIAGIIMIIAYKFNQKRRQKYIKCDELLQENQDFGGNRHQTSSFPFVVSNEDDDSEDEELLNEIDCYQKPQKAHSIV